MFKINIRISGIHQTRTLNSAMSTILKAFLDLQERGKRPQNVILRLATAYSKLPLIFIPKNLTDVNNNRFRNVIFYHLRMTPNQRWGFVINSVIANDLHMGLEICVENQVYPLFRMPHVDEVICVYDRLDSL